MSALPFLSVAVPVEYKNGFPTVNVMLPSRDERCLFTLRPFTDTVGSFLDMVSEEDGGIERIALYKKGTVTTATNLLVNFDSNFQIAVFE